MRRTITDVLKLYHLRLMFKVRASNEPTPVLSKILQQANERTSSWGGKNVFCLFTCSWSSYIQQEILF